MERPRPTATILCIEDEPFLLEELEEELTSKGYTVLTATSGDEAEPILAQTRPDIVLCDVMLPGRNGFELLNDLRSQGKLDDHTAFIFLTALSDREPHLNGLRAGADAYLTKPVDLELLHLQIENTLSFMNRLSDEDEELPEELRDIHLSPREEQVLQLLGEGERTGGIATRDLGAYGQPIYQRALSQARDQQPRRCRASGDSLSARGGQTLTTCGAGDR